ncbi:PREDICTED: transcription initiation factor TFIID subunit 9-like isoform X1 [Camelina sativa]|uniref:Transcription initiation factor TFIID subunit 9-like isoform X1 n=2 Tax=Camelina sativa TaxID=90675 RepID=A0ABM0V2J5_CAMSA|nr:PREDICTED: transcription initiation factor TFIID subunit 9-like isoform X1 [Camelina sativa]
MGFPFDLNHKARKKIIPERIFFFFFSFKDQEIGSYSSIFQDFPRQLYSLFRENMAGEGEEDVPRDAKIVKSLLKSMGVEDYEPRVIHQFLELWYRYVVEVLTDAQVYSEHASKSNIDCDDVKLAIQSKVNFSFSQPPPREVCVVVDDFLFHFLEIVV